jgi:hypothetical protein
LSKQNLEHSAEYGNHFIASIPVENGQEVVVREGDGQPGQDDRSFAASGQV